MQVDGWCGVSGDKFAQVDARRAVTVRVLGRGWAGRVARDEVGKVVGRWCSSFGAS